MAKDDESNEAAQFLKSFERRREEEKEVRSKDDVEGVEEKSDEVYPERRLLEVQRKRRRERRRRAKRNLSVQVTQDAWDTLDELSYITQEDKTNLVEEALRNYFERRANDVDLFDGLIERE